jgi:hypothetical protein
MGHIPFCHADKWRCHRGDRGSRHQHDADLDTWPNSVRNPTANINRMTEVITVYLTISTIMM